MSSFDICLGYEVAGAATASKDEVTRCQAFDVEVKIINCGGADISSDCRLALNSRFYACPGPTRICIYVSGVRHDRCDEVSWNVYLVLYGSLMEPALYQSVLRSL